ncbi:single-stranded DNA-binding protein [Candidatus Saccharibacteria bacterium]|nr:single-stranded DNA-binding protein [Candidatus Saccharibacteria bacterium]MBQ9017290.1 single-stranded DNA-binding protein [Candidatus Saccharibacteria bacterium]
MARGFSKAIIMGNLTRDPEMRTTQSGTSVCSFSVAVNRVYKDSSGNNVEQVSFIDCVAWGRLGETIGQYAKKGSGVLVSGRLDQRSWEDKNGGGKRSRVEIVADDFNFLPRGGQSSDSYGGGNYGASSAPAVGSAEVVPEDIPDEVDLGDIPF